MKKIVCGVTAAAVLCGGVAFANAQVNPYNVLANTNNDAIVVAENYEATAKLRPDVKVNIDGVGQTFYNAQGEEVFPILYNGSTYLPIRAIGEIMNKNVNWDKNTNTATISGERTTESTKGTPNANAQTQDITVYSRSDYTIVIDGTTRTFKDVNGNVVVPMVYNGSIYLPLRAIGEMMGKDVAWDAATNTAVLTPTAGDVTDFDTSNSLTPPTNTGNTNTEQNTGNVTNPTNPTTPTNPTNPTTPAGQITLEQAKQIALNHAGKTADAVQFVATNTDWYKGSQHYKIIFLTTNDNVKYKYIYHISMNGTISQFNSHKEGGYNNGYNNNYNNGNNNNYNNNYNNGNNNNYTGGGNSSSAAAVQISMEQAKQLVLAKVPGATEANIKKIKLDDYKGGYKYEGKIIYGGMKYEFEIDANTGNFIEWEID